MNIENIRQSVPVIKYNETFFIKMNHFDTLTKSEKSSSDIVSLEFIISILEDKIENIFSASLSKSRLFISLNSIIITANSDLSKLF